MTLEMNFGGRQAATKSHFQRHFQHLFYRRTTRTPDTLAPLSMMQSGAQTKNRLFRGTKTESTFFFILKLRGYSYHSTQDSHTSRQNTLDLICSICLYFFLQNEKQISFIFLKNIKLDIGEILLVTNIICEALFSVSANTKRFSFQVFNSGFSGSGSYTFFNLSSIQLILLYVNA